MSLFPALQDFCQQQKQHKNIFWIAYSGGLDSHVLLAACCDMRDEYGIQLRAVHINHGISAQAALWAKHCANVCTAFSVPYDEFAIKVSIDDGESLEEMARQQRYALFARLLGEKDVLLTAHHQDDQAETLLLQLFRGAGPKGLAAMPLLKHLGTGLHFRPFLNISRTTLHRVALERAFKWIEDESNDQKRFTRNFIRHDVLPLLKNRWPAISETLARSAAHCAEAQELLEEYAITLGNNVQGSKPKTLSITKLLQLTMEQQKLVLRHWIMLQGFILPDTKKLQTILATALKASWDKMPCVRWHETELRRYREDIYLMTPMPQHDVTKIYVWQPNQPLYLPGIGFLTMLPNITDGQILPIITVTFRRGGETIDLPNRGTHKLKHLFQEWDVPPWERDRIPLLYIDDQLVAVAGIWTHPQLNCQFVVEVTAQPQSTFLRFLNPKYEKKMAIEEAGDFVFLCD